MISLLKPMLIVLLSLILGYLFGKYYNIKYLNIKKLRLYLQKISLLVLNPIAFLGAVWIAPIRDLRIISLPIVAAIGLISGGFFTFIYCKSRKLDNISTGSLIPIGGFTNIGSIGGIMVFFFLGEVGFSLVPIYKLFEELVYYGIGFPVIKSFSTIKTVEKSRLKSLIRDPFILTMLSAISIGLVLNILGIRRPEIYGVINPILITSATILLLLSIGMALRFSTIKHYVSHAVAVSLIKTLMIPLVTLPIAYLFGLGNIQNNLALKVVLILSVMPAGFVSLVPSSIYGLNTDMSNTAWLGTMLTLFYTMPLLSLLL